MSNKRPKLTPSQLVKTENDGKAHSTKHTTVLGGTPMKAEPGNDWSNNSANAAGSKDSTEKIMTEIWTTQPTKGKQCLASSEGSYEHSISSKTSYNKHNLPQAASSKRQNSVGPQVSDNNINSSQASDYNRNTSLQASTKIYTSHLKFQPATNTHRNFIECTGTAGSSGKQSPSLRNYESRIITTKSATCQQTSVSPPQKHKTSWLSPQQPWGASTKAEKNDGKQEKISYEQQQVNFVTNQSALTARNNDHKQIKIQRFENLGNSCYFNAVVQCLCHTPGLASVLGHSRNDSERPLTETLWRLMEALEQNSTTDVGRFHRKLFETTIRKYPKFADGQQHDSHDVLQCLLNGIKMEDTPSTGTGATSDNSRRTSIDKLFGGSFLSLILCEACKQVDHIVEPFRDIQVPLSEKWHDPTLEGSRRSTIAATGYGTPSLSVGYGLKMTTSVDGIYEPFEAFCRQCYHDKVFYTQAEPQKLLVKARRRMGVLQPPAILVLHLMQFNLDGVPRKIGHKVLFETRFNLGQYCCSYIDLLGLSNSTIYDLYGVVEHSGSIHSGHYNAYVKVASPIDSFQGNVQSMTNSRIKANSGCLHNAPAGEEESCRGQWYKASDSSVTLYSEEEVKKCNAFLLFYKRID